MWERAVVHLNVAHFFVAVERVVDSRYRHRPLIVAPEGRPRALVQDMSEEAYRVGVTKGMPLQRAQRLCPDAHLVTPHPDRYQRAMQALERRLRAYSPLVEVVDHCGHLFLDLTGTSRLWGSALDVAWRIRRELKSELHLEPIWSVAPNKLLAKVATRLVKPAGEYIIEPGEEADVLRPLGLHLLPGLEREELLVLRSLHLERVGQVASLSLEELEVAVGTTAPMLYDMARGVDPSPVLPAEQGSQPLACSGTFPEETNEPAVVEGLLYRLVEAVGLELRRRRLAARRVGLCLGYADGIRTTRSATPATATAHDFRLFAAAQLALQRAWTRRVRLRSLRLSCDRLSYPPAQLELRLEEPVQHGPQQEGELQQTIDGIRQRFGSGAIQLGRTMGLPFQPAGNVSGPPLRSSGKTGRGRVLLPPGMVLR
jgi:DNA polymerase-4